MSHTVASELTGETRSNGTRAVKTIRNTHRAPAGVSHALASGDDVTLCGVPADSLHLFPDLIFETFSFGHRCRDCSGKVASHT
ncbi:hypothetical protein OG439_40395 [Amycolatopsis sp. NBC_01307]|uniref:hypothetical protein n=1 Tax=Amycolatopsis sp. NBC_01307 TaxID=2903561 RepID=UPI002E0FE993|nr:hypothetical protein OG439_40395 [Amycolatopsis sp. NBC_01307]